MELSEETLKKIASDGAKGMQFIIGFANALKKLAAAEKRHAGVTLTSGEVKSVLEALRSLGAQVKEAKRDHPPS